MTWWKEHVPRWASVVALAIGAASGAAGMLWKASADYTEARIEFRALPTAVDSLRRAVFVGRLPERVATLEARTDSIGFLYSAVRDLGNETRAVRALVERVVCLIEVESGEGRPLDCR